MIDRIAAAMGRPSRRAAGIDLAVGLVLLVIATLLVVFLPPLYVVGALTAAIGSLFFLARPDIGILAYFVFRLVADLLWWLPLRFGPLNLLQALSGGATALLGVVFYLEFRRIERHPALVPLVVYLLLLALAALRADDFFSGVPHLTTLASPFLLLFVTTATFRTPAAWRLALGTLAVGGAIPVAVSVYHLATGQMNSYSLAGINRLLGGYANLHNHAHMMGVIASLATFWTFHLPAGRIRSAAGLLAAAAATCLALTNVRTALITFTTFCGVFFFLERRWTMLGLMGLAGVAAFAASETLQARFMDFLLIFNKEDVAQDTLRLGSGRVGIWWVSFQEFMRQDHLKLLLGVGLDGDLAMVESYAYQYRPNEFGEMSPHNDYLALLYTLGPLAVGAYVFMQAQVVWHAVGLRRVTRDRFVSTFASFAAAMSCAVFMANAFSNSYVDRVTPGMVFWSCIGLFYAMVLAHRRPVAAGQAASTPLHGTAGR